MNLCVLLRNQWSVVDDVGVGVWELILPRVFRLFVKGDVDWINNVHKYKLDKFIYLST